MARTRLKTIRGMRDILPDQTPWWLRMERQLVQVLERFGYTEIRTPILETTSLFARSIGEQTDIVSKEMYSFEDRDGSSLTLRPEGTAAVVRAFVEHSLGRQEPVNRLYYLGPMFRHERPQKGRYRQFHQMGAELFGSADPAADVELIDLMVECMAAIGLDQTSLEINSLGDAGCRPAYRDLLVDYLQGHRGDLCEDCQRRLAVNPLRVLDCKQAACTRVAQDAPRMTDHLCAACADHFGQVQAGLESLDHPFRINHRMVRGLNYYNRTAFELLAAGLGAQNAVAGGGRYDGLVASLGGPDVPAVGFASGLDRILLRLLEQLEAPALPPPIFLVSNSDAGWRAGLELAQSLRRTGVRVLTDVRRGSLKSQMKRADKDGARFVVFLGDDELAAGELTIKDMAAEGDQQAKQSQVPTADVHEWLVARLQRAGCAGREEART